MIKKDYWLEAAQSVDYVARFFEQSAYNGGNPEIGKLIRKCADELYDRAKEQAIQKEDAAFARLNPEE